MPKILTSLHAFSKQTQDIYLYLNSEQGNITEKRILCIHPYNPSQTSRNAGRGATLPSNTEIQCIY